ncbi:MAG: beta-CASP ribonuclease aCPSF1 [Thermoplasmata archaeon]
MGRLEEVVKEVRGAIRNIISAEIDVSDVTMEGPTVVVYTKDIEKFAENPEIVKQIAQTIRKRILVRPDPKVVKPPEAAEEEIRKCIPPEADIKEIFFDTETGEVTIEAGNPLKASGANGAIENQIKKITGWVPRIVRAPPIPSKTVEEIRKLLREYDAERKKFLADVSSRICRLPTKQDKWVRVTALGGFREVGRSAALLSTPESLVLIDCGLEPSSEGNGTPFLYVPEIKSSFSEIDAIVVTHAHLDHCGLVPALYKLGYTGPVYCTPPTRDLMALLQIDYIRVSQAEGKKPLYESKHIREMLKHTIVLKYGETTDIAPDIRLTFHNAGHILGSAVAHFHIGEGLYNIAFTGDIKFEKTWLFNQAATKFPRLETIVIEATYGGHKDTQPSREEASERLTQIVRDTLTKGGKVIIPVFAVGRSQEVMLVLEEKMKIGDIPPVPVYLDGMIYEATGIHTTYPEYLNSQLRQLIIESGENPFLSNIFQKVDSAEKREAILGDVESCIVLATSGMMNGGPVMEYFREWAEDSKNTLVFVGYQGEGTLGRRLQKGLKEITLNVRGKPYEVKVEMAIETCEGFSGHSDRTQLLNYIGALDSRPERVVVCHGEESKCIELASTIYKKYGIETRAPMNLETVRVK